MPGRDFQKHLMGLINKSHRLELEYLNSLSDGARDSIGTFETWAPKDRISHNTYWRRRCVESLSYISRGQNPPDYPSYDECNRQNFEETREHSLHVMLREAEMVLSALPLALQRFKEDEFRQNGFHPYLKKNTLLFYTIHNCYQHPLYHVSEGYLHLGNLLQVNAVQDQVMEDIAGIDDSAFSIGTISYDRACFYALAGDSDHAMQYLQKSFGLRPGLAAWAREDNDLIGLREDARFIELVENNQDPAAG